MSGSEFFAFFAFGTLIFFQGLPLILDTCQYRNLSTLPRQWPPVFVSWILAELLLWFVLRHYSSFDVKESGLYLTFYMMFGTAWLALVFRGMRWIDWHYSEDVLERRNPAAASAQAGAVFGIMCSFAGANIGDGPSWVVVCFCSLLSTGSLLLVWLLIQGCASWTADISIERHKGSGILAAYYFIAGGLAAGRSVAGDWLSIRSTLADFSRQIWVLLILGFLALSFQLLNRPRAGRPLYSTLAANAFGLFLLGLSFLWLWMKGTPA